jgi:hypothetical protein
MIMSVPVSFSAGFETGAPMSHGNAGSEDLILHGDEMIVSRRESATAEPIIVTTKWR